MAIKITLFYINRELILNAKYCKYSITTNSTRIVVKSVLFINIYYIIYQRVGQLAWKAKQCQWKGGGGPKLDLEQ